MSARAPLLVTLVLAWANFLLTARWGGVPGALHGWKRPWYFAALTAATVFAVSVRRKDEPVTIPGARALIVGAWIVLAAGFFLSLPLSTWNLLPFVDDWPPRFMATVHSFRLLREGAVAGWQWGLLGGYHLSSDISQNLTAFGALPMLLLGDRVGYHVLHAALFAAIPLVVYLDISADEPRNVKRLSLFLVICALTGYLGALMRSGDTNSIAGVLSVMMALAGSRHAQLGRAWGGPLLVVALTLALYTHTGFFLYGGVYLLLECVFYRSLRMFARLVFAAAVAGVAAVPIYWELIRFPAFFVTNNVIYEPGAVDWSAAFTKMFYNVEIFRFPGRWFNDYLGLTRVFFAIVLWVATRGSRRRPIFYAWCAVATVAMLTCNVTYFGGYLFARPVHMLAVLTPVVIAWFLVEHVGHRALAVALLAVVALYGQSNFDRVPHVTEMREFDPALFDRLQSADGSLILLEGNPHRDLIAAAGQETEPTPFNTHFDSLFAESTGRRLYGQTWDGWHWTPWRGQTVSGGSFRGKAIAEIPVSDFVSEMRKWGVVHLLVWSGPTKDYLTQASAQFTPVWSSGLWTDFQLSSPDPRDIVIASGSGSFRDLNLLGGTIALRDVRRGDEVVARMNYFPAWQATAGGRAVALRSQDGQLAFDAPDDGTYDVRLEYPRRQPLLAFSFVAFIAGCFTVQRFRA